MTILKTYLRNSSEASQHSIAMEVAKSHFSYGYLYDFSRRFSKALRLKGVLHKSKIAIWLPKTAESYISIFGALENNSLYIPIDISSPAARVNYILSSSNAEVLVCRISDLRQYFPEVLNDSIKLVILVNNDVQRPELESYRSERYIWWDDLQSCDHDGQYDKCEEVQEEDSAYILYTSGSTGVPKGVVVSHRAASCFIEWAAETVGLNCEDRVSNHASLSFDLSIFDIFATVSVGARILPLPALPIATGYPFSKFIAERRVTIWYSVPTLLVRISESQEKRPLDISCLHTVIFAGEVFHKAELHRFHSIHTDVNLYNWYGPTETNVCIFHKITSLDLDNCDPIPIGQPCPYSKVKIVKGLDEAAGELLVSGLSLMSGYWVDDGLDRKNFIVGLEDEEIYYATGDLVKIEGGNLQYCGRKDNQIKRHGYRIELGEIEYSVLQVENVSEAVSIYLDGEIIVYVVLHPLMPSINNGELMQRLMANIPIYMKPNRLKIVESLPRNERGKVDKIKLAEEYRNTIKTQNLL